MGWHGEVSWKEHYSNKGKDWKDAGDKHNALDNSAEEAILLSRPIWETIDYGTLSYPDSHCWWPILYSTLVKYDKPMKAVVMFYSLLDPTAQ